MLPVPGQPVDVHSVNRDKMLAAIEHVRHFARTEGAFRRDE
jgi:hypothetical protein